MASHGACTNGTSWVLKVASLPRLNMEALILTPADHEVRSLIKLFNIQSMAPIKICQLCQVYGHPWLDGQHISCRSSAVRRSIIIHPIARTSRPVISIFYYTSRNYCSANIAFSEWQRGGDECYSGSNPRQQTSTTQGCKSWSHGMRNVPIPEVNMLKSS